MKHEVRRAREVLEQPRTLEQEIKQLTAQMQAMQAQVAPWMEPARREAIEARIREAGCRAGYLAERYADAVAGIGEAISKVQSQKCRTILLDYYIKQKSLQEIAEEMGSTAGSVYAYHRRGLLAVSEYLPEPLEIIPPDPDAA